MVSLVTDHHEAQMRQFRTCLFTRYLTWFEFCFTNLSLFGFAQLPLNAHQQAGWQDISSWWHPPRASVYSDKITGRAMSWWGEGDILYLGVKTLTNLPVRLRSVKRSKCTRVCQRCNQQVDVGPWLRWWHNNWRVMAMWYQFKSLAWGTSFLKNQFLFFNVFLALQHYHSLNIEVIVTLLLSTENMTNNEHHTEVLHSNHWPRQILLHLLHSLTNWPLNSTDNSTC